MRTGKDWLAGIALAALAVAGLFFVARSSAQLALIAGLSLCLALLLIAVVRSNGRLPSLTPEDLKDVATSEERMKLVHERARVRIESRNSLFQALTGLAVLATIAFTWYQLNDDRQQRQ